MTWANLVGQALEIRLKFLFGEIGLDEDRFECALGELFVVWDNGGLEFAFDNAAHFYVTPFLGNCCKTSSC